MKIILNKQHLSITIKRLSQQILENQIYGEETVLIGIQPRGVFLSDRINELLNKELPLLKYGRLDITFYRDDILKEFTIANKT